MNKLCSTCQQLDRAFTIKNARGVALLSLLFGVMLALGFAAIS